MTTDGSRKRRPRGDYTCYYSEKRGRWRAEATVGYDSRGKRQVITRFGTSESGALKALRQAVRERAEGVSRQGDKMTVRQAVEEFLDYGLPKASEATMDNYRSLVANNLGRLADVRLARLTVVEVEDWLRVVAEGHSSSTVGLVHSLLQRSLDRAIRHRLIRENVAALAEVPEGRSGRPSKSFTLKQVSRILADGQGHWFYPYVATSLLTGIRTEEARALLWSDVHLSSKKSKPSYVDVVRAVRVRGETKTFTSRRGIAVSKACVKVLKQQRKMQARMRRAAGDSWKDTGLVFTTRVGTALDTSNARRAFRSLLKLVDGINPDEWTPRELRHTFVSILSASDVNIDQIAQMVGHTNSRTTETVYRKQIRPVLRYGAEAMDSIFPKALPDSLPDTPSPGARKWEEG